MAKKGLAALASKQINSTAQASTPAPDQVAAPEQAEETTAVLTQPTTIETTTETRKPGRPKKKQEEDAPLTVRLPKTLLYELKLRAVMEHTTQTKIVETLIKDYLNK